MADEALRMPLCVERSDVVVHDRPLTAFAARREHAEVVLATECLAVLLVESVFAELAAALRAEEVLRMPGLVQSGDALLQKQKRRRCEPLSL